MKKTSDEINVMSTTPLLELAGLYPLYHSPGCGKVAFYTRYRLIENVDSFEPSNVVKVNGEVPVDGEYIICGSCGQFLEFELTYEKPLQPVV